MNICTILASGTGERMKKAPGTLPKQFVEVGGQPLLCYTLKTVVESGAFDYIYLGLSTKFISFGNDIIKKYFNNINIEIVEGGDSRMRTFFNIFDKIRRTFETFSEDDYICLTDANRPLISKELYKNCLLGATRYGICCPARPVVDGVCVVKSKTIHSIPEKNSMYSFQTPECFRITDFLDICPTYEHVGKCLGITEVFSAAGMSPHVIESDDRSFKITTPIDLEILKAYLDV